MRNLIFIKGVMLSLLLPVFAFTQSMHYDTLQAGRVIIEKDARLDILNSKMTGYYEGLSKKPRLENGFRLMLLSTTDRARVTELRTRLLQLYPDQKVYTLFQAPYIKVKFGNFLEREQAEAMKKEIAGQGLVEGNIYVVSEKVEIRGARDSEDGGGGDGKTN